MGELAKSTIPVSSFRSCLTNPHSPPNNERSHSLTMYNNSERPVDALALILEKGELLTDSLTSASKNSRKVMKELASLESPSEILFKKYLLGKVFLNF